MDRGVVPGQRNRETILFGLAGALALFGLALLGELPEPPFTGRGALFFQFVYAVFGPFAVPVFVLLIALVLISMGLAAKRRRVGSRD